MMSWLRKYNKQVLLFTFLSFMLTSVAFIGVEGFSLTPMSPVLVVNGEKVPYKRFETRLMNRLQQEPDASPEKLRAIKESVLQELTQETAFLQEADRYGIQAADAEVAAILHGAPAFQRDGRFDQSLYFATVSQALRMTPAAFEEEQRRNVRRQKLFMLLSSAVKVSSGEAAEYARRHPGSAPDQGPRSAAAQEQGNAAMQLWLQQLSGRIKAENRLERWEKAAS